MPIRTRLKVCCIGSCQEAAQAIRMGASAIGLVSAMPSGPGVIEEPLIRQIADTVPPPIATFLLTSSRSVPHIVEQHRRCRPNTIQLCDQMQAGDHARLREALPGVSLVQVIHVLGPHSVEEAQEVDSHVDAILLDSGNPSLKIKQLGGTGRTHEWSFSRQIREAVESPVFLAGGLTPDNVKQAIDTVEPFGVDVCSGVRTEGRLDAEKLQAFTDSMLRAAP